MNIVKISGNGHGETPSSGRQLVDAFNENFEQVNNSISATDKELNRVAKIAEDTADDIRSKVDFIDFNIVNNSVKDLDNRVIDIDDSILNINDEILKKASISDVREIERTFIRLEYIQDTKQLIVFQSNILYPDSDFEFRLLRRIRKNRDKQTTGLKPWAKRPLKKGWIHPLKAGGDTVEGYEFVSKFNYFPSLYSSLMRMLNRKQVSVNVERDFIAPFLKKEVVNNVVTYSLTGGSRSKSVTCFPSKEKQERISRQMGVAVFKNDIMVSNIAEFEIIIQTVSADIVMGVAVK